MYAAIGPQEIKDVLSRANGMLTSVGMATGIVCDECCRNTPEYWTTPFTCSECEEKIHFKETHCDMCKEPFTDDDPGSMGQHEGCWQIYQ